MAKSRKDWTGIQLGKLTFTKPVNVGTNAHMWEAICECGGLCTRNPWNVRGKNSNCGCAYDKDYTGIKCSMLTFLKKSDKKVNNHILWELLCECGKTHYARADDVLRHRITNCGCNTTSHLSAAGMKSRKLDPKVSSARAIWRGNYKDCDFDTFYYLSQQPCDYCGSLPHRVANIAKYSSRKDLYSDTQLHQGNFAYNGLDRIDNTKGHYKDNVVPCCWDCNRAKGNRTRAEFLAHNARIYLHATGEHDYVW